jgi:hypothetical protein
MNETDDDALDADLARALGPDADDTAPLSQAVLNRLARQGATNTKPALGEVLTMPLPAAAVMLAALCLAGTLGYAFSPVAPDEVTALIQVLGPGL